MKILLFKCPQETFPKNANFHNNFSYHDIKTYCLPQVNNRTKMQLDLIKNFYINYFFAIFSVFTDIVRYYLNSLVFSFFDKKIVYKKVNSEILFGKNHPKHFTMTRAIKKVFTFSSTIVRL